MGLREKLNKILYKVSNPERYIGDEWNIIRKEWKDKIRVVLAFPDVYEIGMSHLGLKILYHILNKEEDILCERTFAPWPDMEELLQKESLPLFSLESKHSIRDFDIFGFTLQYEMSYTNIINMIKLAGLPLYSKDRNADYPLVIGGGSTVYNPEPIAPFIDLFFIGEAEDGIVNLVRKYQECRESGLNREQVLDRLSKIPGVYIPSLYEIMYKESGSISNIKPIRDNIKKKVERQIVTDLDQAFYPTDFIVPYMDIVHNRAVLEISRGCTRGCRFCAAGISYRPVRERKKDTLIELADKIVASTGFEDISLTSLSAVDYSDIENLIKELAARYEDEKVSISLSSLRVDEFSVKLAEDVNKVRKTGLTFAPEAGTQRLRNVINKGVNEKDLYNSVRAAFQSGWSRIKLYFMIGLPTETEEDLAGLVKMARNVLEIGRKIRKERKNKMRPIKIHVSVSTFVPKPFTPFQWVEMISKEEIIKKQSYLRDNLRGRGLDFSWNDPDLSLLEGAMARGDRRLASVLESVWKKGARFDGWGDHFDFDLWQEAFADNDLELEDYTRGRDLKEKLPWSHLFTGVNEGFLRQEYKKAFQEEITPDCRTDSCTGCNICFDLDVEMELVGADKNVNQD